jgi:hypothetical protein
VKFEQSELKGQEEQGDVRNEQSCLTSWLARALAKPVVMISSFTHPTKEFTAPTGSSNIAPATVLERPAAPLRPQGRLVVPAPCRDRAPIRMHEADLDNVEAGRVLSGVTLSIFHEMNVRGWLGQRYHDTQRCVQNSVRHCQ